MHEIVSGFCGVGKSYLCKRRSNFEEIECWKYNGQNFPQNYLNEIENVLERSNRVFISTDIRVLKNLTESFLLVYPKVELKDEYIKRFERRGSSNDFIETLSENWENWINELNSFDRGTHFELSSEQYLEDVLKDGKY